MESLTDRLPSGTLSCHLRLEAGEGREAALQSRALMSPEQWALLVEFALAVVLIAEDESQRVAVMAPGKILAGLLK